MAFTPSESPAAVRMRSYIIISFWAVIVLLGLPIWLYTTSIERAALPTDIMLASEREVPQYDVLVHFAAPSIPCESAEQLVHHIQTTLDERNEFPIFRIKIKHVNFTPRQGQPSSCSAVNVAPDEDISSLDIELVEGSEFSFDRFVAPARVTYAVSETASVASNIADAIRTVFVEEQASVAYYLMMQGNADQALSDFVQNLPQDTGRLVERSAARAFKASPTYHLTFSLFTAGGTPYSWDIQPALNRYINPILHSLSSAANFSITSQIQLYSAFSSQIQPVQDGAGQGWFLKEDELTAFINTAEWPLSPSIGQGPTINFVLYIPHKTQIPLRIQHSQSNSWIVPQWGAILIQNPELTANPETHANSVISHLANLGEAFEIFQDQLLRLLGVPSLAQSPLSVRLKAFQRMATFSMHLKSSSNLGALARLSQRLSNIPIPHHVADLVQTAIDSLARIRNNVSRESKFVPHDAREAYLASEKAFFDKSMVGQVYFPDEHKVAVYLPLLGPIGVPLVIGLIREVKRFLG